MTRKEVLKIVTTEYDGLSKVDDKYRNDYEIVKQAVLFWPYQIRYASAYLKSNKELGLIAVKEDGLLISELEYNLKSDKDIITEALKQDGTAIKYISEDDKCYKEYVDLAIKSNPYAINYINDSMITIEHAKYCLSIDSDLFCNMSYELKNNLEIVKFIDKLDGFVHLNPTDEKLYQEFDDPFADFGAIIEDDCSELPF